MSKRVSIFDRIAKVLSDKTTSAAAVYDLAQEAANAAQEKAAEADKAEEAALDPTLSASEAERLEDEAQKVRFAVRRLERGVHELEKYHEARVAAEADAVRQENYAAAEMARDVASEMIAKEYPDIQAALSRMINAIGEAHGLVDAVNADLPEGAVPLNAPEAHAFGYQDSPLGRPTGYRPPTIFEMLVPDSKNWEVPLWPPRWNGGRPGRLTDVQLRHTFQNDGHRAGNV